MKLLASGFLALPVLLGITGNATAATMNPKDSHPAAVAGGDELVFESVAQSANAAGATSTIIENGVDEAGDSFFSAKVTTATADSVSKNIVRTHS
ncbi:hypothetical protein [Streptomyces sp. NPDC090112]|uniref:hypothetical protein n=1 Tax=Streptomyces sp. NPDC090112 TaxID=3365949 RepID=UPI00380920D1